MSTAEGRNTAGFPDDSTMVEMVSADLLSYWDEYDEESFSFTSRLAATSLREEATDGFIFAVQDSHDGSVFNVTVPRMYFLDFVNRKAEALEAVKEQVVLLD